MYVEIAILGGTNSALPFNLSGCSSDSSIKVHTPNPVTPSLWLGNFPKVSHTP